MLDQQNSEHWYILAGSYSNADEKGIHLLRFDAFSGKLEMVRGISGVENASFLTYDPQASRFFAVSEKQEGEVVSYSLNRSNLDLKELSRQSTQGVAPCFVSLDETGRQLFAVNYSGGSVCTFPIAEDGTIGSLSKRIQHSGQSVHTDRQEAPHPHSIVPVPESQYFMVPDLGTDRIYIYHSEPGNPLMKHDEIETAPGAGPRHVSFHPSEPVAYVINELNATISIYSYDRKKGSFSLMQTVSTVPEEFTGPNTTADIHIAPSGRYLYGSNRGHDSIVTFRVLADGKLEPVGFTSTLGKTPRNFTILPEGKFMLVANQDSDLIVVMELKEDGVPVPTGQNCKVQKPVCLKVVPE